MLKDRRVTCTIPELAPRVYQRVVVRAKVTGGKVGDRLGATLVAVADNASRSPGGGSTEDHGPSIVENSADLEVGRSGHNPTVAPGGEVSYEGYLMNNGPFSAATAKMVIKPDPRLSEVSVRASDGPGCTRVQDRFECPAGKQTYFALSAKAPSAGGVTLMTTYTAEFSDAIGTTDPKPDNNTWTVRTVVEEPAVLDVRLTVEPASIPASALKNEPELSYRAVVTNKGPGKARDTSLVMHYPDGILPRSANPCTYSSPCQIGELAAGAQREFVLAAKATLGVRDPKPAASAVADAANSVTAMDSAELRVLDYTADLTLGGGALPAQVVEGKPVTFTLQAANLGPFTPLGSYVRLELDGVQGDPQVRADGPDASCRQTGHGSVSRTIDCLIPDLGSQPRTITVTTVPTRFAGDRLTVSGHIKAKSGYPYDPIWQNSEVRQSTSIITQGQATPDLKLTSSAAPASVVPGKPVSYPLVVRNDGTGSATQVKITAAVPAGLVSLAGPGCSTANGSLTCDVGALDSGATRNLTLTGRVRPNLTGSLAATFTATPPNNDPTPADNVTTIRSTAKPSADLKVTGTVGKLIRRKRATYTITVVNNGPSDARGVTLTGTLPRGLTVVSVKGCKRARNGIRCTRDRIVPGQRLKVTITVLVGRTSQGLKTFKVNAVARTPDSARSNNTAAIRRTVTRR